jgi:HSP20 family protein
MAKKSKEKEVATSKETEIQRAEPTRALSPFEEMDRLFESLYPRHWMHPLRWEHPLWSEMMRPLEGRIPKLDVLDRDDDVLVRAEVPGFAKEDLDISVTDNTVTIKGESKHEEKEEKGDYYRCEISRGSFARTVALPGNVDPDKAAAKFTDGILELTIPKVEKAKRRTVKVD